MFVMHLTQKHLRRRVGDGSWSYWTSYKFDNWDFEFMNEKPESSKFTSLLGNKRIQFGFGKSSRLEPSLWRLISYFLHLIQQIQVLEIRK
jgi:hypothetical protein